MFRLKPFAFPHLPAAGLGCAMPPGLTKGRNTWKVRSKFVKGKRKSGDAGMIMILGVFWDVQGCRKHFHKYIQFCIPGF